MKPYGLHFGMWRDEDYGPPSKYRKVKAKNRREYRRLLHKEARNKVKREIRKELDDKL